MNGDPSILLTDAPKPRPNGECPTCGAPKTQRIASAGFGRVAKELCGKCGHFFGMKEL